MAHPSRRSSGSRRHCEVSLMWRLSIEREPADSGESTWFMQDADTRGGCVDLLGAYMRGAEGENEYAVNYIVNIWEMDEDEA